MTQRDSSGRDYPTRGLLRRRGGHGDNTVHPATYGDLERTRSSRSRAGSNSGTSGACPATFLRNRRVMHLSSPLDLGEDLLLPAPATAHVTRLRLPRHQDRRQAGSARNGGIRLVAEAQTAAAPTPRRQVQKESISSSLPGPLQGKALRWPFFFSSFHLPITPSPSYSTFNRPVIVAASRTVTRQQSIKPGFQPGTSGVGPHYLRKMTITRGGE